MARDLLTWAPMARPADLGTYGAARFNLSDGVVRDHISDTEEAGIIALPSGWFRCWMRLTFTQSDGVLTINLLDSMENRYTAIFGGSGVLLWGLQVEKGSQPTGLQRSLTRPRRKLGASGA